MILHTKIFQGDPFPPHHALLEIIQSKMYLSSVCVNVEHLGVLSAIFSPLYITNADIMFSEGISKKYKV